MKVQLVRQALRIVSGGQTGADQAGLHWAIDNEVDHGGWCPKGRKTEEGLLDPKFRLKETPSASYLQRTEWNVRDSDATIIFTMTEPLSGGSKRTAEFARKHGKPWIALSPGRASDKLAGFLSRHGVRVLNIGGSRHSTAPDVAAFVRQTLNAAISPRDSTADLFAIRDLIRDGGTAIDALASLALVDLLKSVFLLSIPLMTRELGAALLGTEKLQPAHARVLRRWLADARDLQPILFDQLREFLRELDLWAIAATDDAAKAWPASQTTQQRTMMNLCHDAKERAVAAALLALPLEELVRLSILWIAEKNANRAPGVLESLGLTADTLVELPESELARLNLIERLEEEAREERAAFGRFLKSDPAGERLSSVFFETVLIDFE
ncbi:Putative molybdenum carrier [Caballeronia calidae]|uniref:Molybdenum carrier n=1 Tax=Caballeronia calidae TaxID=1777139 RepID=A0A158EFA8_9BURK|nr:putative molybdenum carrier protein [Caballeronia calidae]SAL05555.1 Putative molybdenum carrier [Caballeronia calidae]